MIIEVLVKWADFKIKDRDTEEDYLKRVVDGEEPQQQMDIKFDYSPMCFDVDDIGRFNRANDPNFTTIRFKDGELYVIKVPYLKFRDLYTELTGKSILELDLSEKNDLDKI
jgi:hypothetical protein